MKYIALFVCSVLLVSFCACTEKSNEKISETTAIRPSGDITTVFSEENYLSNQLAKNGISVESCVYNKEEGSLKVSIVSDTDGNQINPDTIRVMRVARNAIRYELDDLTIVNTSKNYNEVIMNTNNKVLVDSNKDIIRFPSYPECKKLKESIKVEVDAEKLKSQLTECFSSDFIFDVSNSDSTGTTVSIRLYCSDKNCDEINEIITNLIMKIDFLNSESTNIHQLEISVYKESNSDFVFYMYSDLVYRDFLWWQTPDIKQQWKMY